jgi:hypothetical protein
MTDSEYPTLTIPGYDLYQAAVLASFVADALARHRRATDQSDQPGRESAAGDVRAGRLALSRVTADPAMAEGPLPRPLDVGTYAAAQDLLSQRDGRNLQVVSLATLDRPTWAVVGRIPGVGAVGAEVSDPQLAETLRRHLLVAPVTELAGWAVTPSPVDLRTERLETTDAAAVVSSLDPDNHEHRYIAAALGGTSAKLDRAIGERFPPRLPPTGTASPAAGVTTSAESATGFPAAAAALTPSRSAGVRISSLWSPFTGRAAVRRTAARAESALPRQPHR